METLDKMRARAQRAGIEEFTASMENFPAISIKLNGKYRIGLDPEQLDTESEQCVAFTHELGHIVKSAMISDITQYETIGRLEHRAWKYAVHQLLPRKRLEQAVRSCQGRLWEVAEELRYPQHFIERALDFYSHERE